MYRLTMHRRINGLYRLVLWFDCEHDEAIKFLKMAGYNRMGQTPHGDRWINNAYRVKDDVVDVYVVMDKIDELENSF